MNLSPVTVIGNLTADPEVTTTSSGHKRATFSVAVEHRYKQGDEWTSKPSFFNVTVWRQTADRVEQLLTKGMGVIVIGRLDQRTWENDGQKRSIVSIEADNVAINVWSVDSVTRRQAGSGGGGSSSSPSTPGPDESPW